MQFGIGALNSANSADPIFSILLFLYCDESRVEKTFSYLNRRVLPFKRFILLWADWLP